MGVTQNSSSYEMQEQEKQQSILVHRKTPETGRVLWVRELLLLAVEILNLSSEKDALELKTMGLPEVWEWVARTGEGRWPGGARAAKAPGRTWLLISALPCPAFDFGSHIASLNLSFFICSVAIIPSLSTSRGCHKAEMLISAELMFLGSLEERWDWQVPDTPLNWWSDSAISPQTLQGSKQLYQASALQWCL